MCLERGDDADYMTVVKTFRAIARKVKQATTTVAGIGMIARNEDVDDTETDTSRLLDVLKGKRLVERVVPAWPGRRTPLQVAGDPGGCWVQSGLRWLIPGLH